MKEPGFELGVPCARKLGGRRVTVVVASMRQGNKHSRLSAASASGSVTACGSSAVVPTLSNRSEPAQPLARQHFTPLPSKDRR